jgi:hypothetical protein
VTKIILGAHLHHRNNRTYYNAKHHFLELIMCMMLFKRQRLPDIKSINTKATQYAVTYILQNSSDFKLNTLCRILCVVVFRGMFNKLLAVQFKLREL